MSSSSSSSTSSTSVQTAPSQKQQQQQLFIPYRDSILTRVLQSSLDGNYVNFAFLCVSNESNASISHSLRMTMELRGRIEHVER